MEQQKQSKFNIPNLLQQLEVYISKTPYPSIHEFALKVNVYSLDIQCLSEASHLLHKMQDKRRVYVEKKLILEKGNPVKWLFLLKSDHGMVETQPKDQLPAGEDRVRIEITGKTSAKMVQNMLEFQRKRRVEIDQSR